MNPYDHARMASSLLVGIEQVQDRLDNLTEDERLQRVVSGAVRSTNESIKWTTQLAIAHALTAIAMEQTGVTAVEP